MSPRTPSKHLGFTLIELLVTIAIIGLLAAVAVPIYTAATDASKKAEYNAELSMLHKGMTSARILTRQPLNVVTGSNGTAGGCTGFAPGTDLAAVPKTDYCWVRYFMTLDKIGAASGSDLSNLIDPWGRPYFIDENESEQGGCSRDSVGLYPMPYVGGWTHTVPGPFLARSGFSGCAVP